MHRPAQLGIPLTQTTGSARTHAPTYLYPVTITPISPPSQPEDALACPPRPVPVTDDVEEEDAKVDSK